MTPHSLNPGLFAAPATPPEKLRLAALGAAVALLLPVLGCEEEQVLTTTRNIDRPGPMALVCAARVGDAGVTVGLAPSACTSDAGTRDSAKGTLYGFVANTARGEVALFRPGSSGEPLVDLDRGSPGFGFIPVGSSPTDLQATSDGCRVVSANSGSCDLSLIDVPATMNVAAQELKTGFGGAVSRVIPRTPSNRLLRARPRELSIVPASVPAKGTGQCPRPGAYRAFVTFPRCNLLAEIDLATGKLVQGIIITRDGIHRTTEPVCPVECTMRDDPGRVDGSTPELGPPDDLGPGDGGTKDSGAVPDRASGAGDGSAGVQDAGPADAPADAPRDGAAGEGGGRGDGGWVTSGDVLPSGLALSTAGDALYVSSGNAGFISVFPVTPATGALGRPRRIPLSDGVPVTRLKLSPPTRKIGQFLYAVAADRSVRVISTALEKECETNLDLARVAAPTAGIPLGQARCFVVGAAGTPPRRVTEKRAGLRFGSRLPQDVLFVKSVPTFKDASVGKYGPESLPLHGIYALVATSDGTIYVVDVEDWNYVKGDAGALSPLHLPHRFRNELQGTSKGSPDAAVSAITGAGTQGVPVVVSKVRKAGLDGGTALPGQGVALRALGESVSSDWSLVYEDSLVSRWSGNLEIQSEQGGGELWLADRGATYCKAGVLGRKTTDGRPTRHGDIVSIVGCKNDDECGLEQVCTKPVTQQTDYGLCFDKDREDELFEQCSEFLRGKREYLVTRAHQDKLVIDALPREPQIIVRQSPQPAQPCATNEECAPTFLCAIEDRAVAGRSDLSIKKGECFRPGCTQDRDCGTSGRCVQPLDGGPRVCSHVPLPLERGPSCQRDLDCQAPAGLPSTCGANRDCKSSLAECRRRTTLSTSKSCVDKGMVCARFPGLKGVCVRRSPCFGDLLRYDVLVGQSFLVGGYAKVVADPETSECKPDPTQDPLMVSRLPIGPAVYPVLLGPQCTQPASPLATPQPNPCVERSSQGYIGWADKGGSAEVLVYENGPATVVRFANPEIWFSLGVSHMTGVTTSPGVDAGPAGSDNMPKRGLTIDIDLLGGYSRLRTATSATVALPVWLVDGPDNYVYIVDMGDRIGSTGTRGQIVRIGREDLELDDFVVR